MLFEYGGSGAGHGRPRVHGGEPSLELRIVDEGIAFSLQHLCGTIDPAPRRYVGDRAAAADDVVAAGQVIVENSIVPFGLASIPVRSGSKAFEL
jgi:hypothetical protein